MHSWSSDWNKRANWLAKHGLYNPAEEHDACGVGLVAAIDGKPRREVVEAGINALRFDTEDLPTFWDLLELAVFKRGTLSITNKSLITSLPGVFAAGDMVRGVSLIVWAIKDGRDATEVIHKWVGGQQHV